MGNLKDKVKVNYLEKSIHVTRKKPILNIHSIKKLLINIHGNFHYLLLKETGVKTRFWIHRLQS